MLFWIFVSIAAIALFLTLFSNYQYKAYAKKYRKACDAWSESNDRTTSNKLYQEKEKYDQISDRWQLVSNWAFGILIVMIIALLISFTIFACVYETSVKDSAKLDEEYAIYTYQLEHGSFSNDVGDTLGSVELFENIKYYNVKVRSGQYWEKNFWLGIYVPNIYSNKSLITLP